MEGVIGEIRLFAGDFAPRNWSFCQGQLLAIQTNQALFSILGTAYGGNGITNFGLPDFQGRVPVGAGQFLPVGGVTGSETTQLNLQNLPVHTHTASGTVHLGAKTGKGIPIDTPASNFYSGQNTTAPNIYGSTTDKVMGSSSATITVNAAGQGQPFSTMAPFLCLNYIICLYGIFPDRN